VPNKDYVMQIFILENLRYIIDEGLQRRPGRQEMRTLTEPG